MLLVYIVVLVVIFVFKQETAYGMRISDWSSDVCSSDLFGAGGGIGMAGELVAHVAVEADIVEEIMALEDAVMLDDPMILFRQEGLEDRRGDVGVASGRASCRGRGCQYVEISGVSA